VALAASFPRPLQAGSPVVTDNIEATEHLTTEDQIYDKIWGLSTFYKNADNPVFEQLDFIGRYQGDYFNVDSRRGDTSYYETRRFRLGLEATLAEEHIFLKAELDTNMQQYRTKAVFYNRMTNLFVRFRLNDAFVLTIGKAEPHFGYDREVSDRLQPFFERSFFDDQFMPGPDYLTGAVLSGKIDHWGYEVGVYSDNVDKELGQYNGGQSELGEISYDFAHAMQAEKALWVLDYLHVQGLSAHTNIFESFHNGLATYFDYKAAGKFGFVSQLGYGNGVAAKGDIYELMMMPTYDITKKLQVELRYQLGLASEANGITTLNRQEKTIGKYTGDNYEAVYLGANYFIYGYKLRIMSGIQYENLSGGTGKNAGNSGWTALTGFRVYW